MVKSIAHKLKAYSLRKKKQKQTKFSLTSKIRKITWIYYWKYCQPRTNLPIHWHTGRPNFGDDINPLFFKMVTGNKFRLITRKDRQRNHFLGIGSILERSNEMSIILGSGFLENPIERNKVSYKKIISVRGQLTLNILFPVSGGGEIYLGDPMVLIDLFVPKSGKKNINIGLAPHESNVEAYTKKFGRRFNIIDTRKRPFEVIRLISNCKFVICQSLHSLIVADAMEVPNLWLEPTRNMTGGDFKFRDYFTTLEKPKQPYHISQLNDRDPDLNDFEFGYYIYDKKNYLDRLIQATSSFRNP